MTGRCASTTRPEARSSSRPATRARSPRAPRSWADGWTGTWNVETGALQPFQGGHEHIWALEVSPGRDFDTPSAVLQELATGSKVRGADPRFRPTKGSLTGRSVVCHSAADSRAPDPGPGFLGESHDRRGHPGRIAPRLRHGDGRADVRGTEDGGQWRPRRGSAGGIADLASFDGGGRLAIAGAWIRGHLAVRVSDLGATGPVTASGGDRVVRFGLTSRYVGTQNRRRLPKNKRCTVTTNLAWTLLKFDVRRQ
jgi:hypothetical protein